MNRKYILKQKIEEIKLKLKNKDMDPDENKVAETGFDTTRADPPKSGSPHGLLQWGLDNRYCIFLSTHCTNYVIINQIIIIMRKTYDSIPIQMVERMEK